MHTCTHTHTHTHTHTQAETADHMRAKDHEHLILQHQLRTLQLAHAPAHDKATRNQELEALQQKLQQQQLQLQAHTAAARDNPRTTDTPNTSRLGTHSGKVYALVCSAVKALCADF